MPQHERPQDKGEIMRAVFVPVIAAMLLAGCAQTIPMTESAIRANTTASADPYLKTASISGPRVGGILETNYNLRRAVIGGRTFDYVMLTYVNKNWAFLSSAVDIDSKILRISQPIRDVGVATGDISEILSVSLPDGYLRQHENSGINIRVDGQRGFTVIIIPQAYIKGFLSAAEGAQKVGI